MGDILPGRRVSISLGVATREAGEHSLASMIQRADRALYRAKASGRNRVEDAGEGSHCGGTAEGEPGHRVFASPRRSSAV